MGTAQELTGTSPGAVIKLEATIASSSWAGECRESSPVRAWLRSGARAR